MSGTDWAAIIGAGTVFVTALGKGIAWLIGFVTNRADKTIKDQDEQIGKQAARITLLEETLRQNGVPVP